MYSHLFGLKKNPFNMTPDPDLLYLAPSHREALAGLAFAILAGKGFVALTGDAGTGKTTLLSRVMQRLPNARVQYSLLVNPTLTPSEFLEMVMIDFGLSSPPSKTQRLLILEQFLQKAHEENRIPVLVVDEAHTLSREVLEEIRLLANFERAEKKLLQIVLAGQTELGAILNQDNLRQLKQRIAVRLTIQPLAPHEVEEYLQFRWTQCGGTDLPFLTGAVTEIAARSKGIPRLINSICDNSLTLAKAAGAPTVSLDQVREACRDLDIDPVKTPANSTVKPPTPAPVAEVTVRRAIPAAAPAKPVAPVPVSEVPDIELDMDLSTLKTLQRYTPEGEARRSLLARFAGKLGFAN